MPSRYAVVSLPLGVFDSSSKADAISSLSASISPDNGSVNSFNIPDFKIGTLDALVQQADDLAKLETTCQSVVTKVGESLRSVLDNDEERLASYKMVNDSIIICCVEKQDNLAELSFPQELVTVDNDVKTKFSQYNTVKSNLAALQRRQT
ncbi:V-type proton ATPase subunit C 1-A [Metarhizium anisopliae]|nr:V-type proton ATPase subunit C 1-A [Metarhizium anisopliae]